ncbi:GAP family protein [Gordonia terrae]|nr:GAP family protein [Gordonia terrae]
MLSGELLSTVAGLAFLDSFNPATIAGVALILLALLHRPVTTAVAYVVGAYGIVLAVGVSLFIGAGELGEAVQSGATWVRRAALLLAAMILVISAIQRLKTRSRSAITLPGWIGPWTAAPLGVVATGADLPNAFPYLIAIERLTAADVAIPLGVVVLAGYALVYCIPCLVLLLVGTIWRHRINGRLQKVYDRLGAARTVPRSVPIAATLLALAIGAGTIATAL